MTTIVEALLHLEALQENPLSNEEMAMFMLAEVAKWEAQLRPCNTYKKYACFCLDRYTSDECK